MSFFVMVVGFKYKIYVDVIVCRVKGSVFWVWVNGGMVLLGFELFCIFVEK